MFRDNPRLVTAFEDQRQVIAETVDATTTGSEATQALQDAPVLTHSYAQQKPGGRTTTSDSSATAAICLTPFVLAAIVLVITLVTRSSSRKRAQQRAAEQQRLAAEHQHRAWHAEQQRLAYERQVWEAGVARQRAAVEAEQAAVEAAADARHRAREAQEQQRVADIVARFGPAMAGRILRGEIWQGQTNEQLVAALGQPADVEERVMKTKAKAIYKYAQSGANRFGLRVTLEQGVVVGWEDKR